jgi:apolipoprotein N-acyltransferase
VTARGALAVAAGSVATACAIAVLARLEPWSVPLGWLCLVPWLAALERTRSFGGALAAGLALSVAFALAVFPWLADAIAGYTGASRATGVLAVLVLAPLLEPQLVAFAMARHVARHVAGAAWWATALVGAGAYVGTEWAVPKPFADTLGHVWYASPTIRQAADLGGAHGLTFVLVLGNECALVVLRELVARARRPPARAASARLAASASCLALLVAGAVGYGAMRSAQLAGRAARDEVRIAFVQANVAHYDRMRAEIGAFAAVTRILDAHFALSREALAEQRPDLLVWPETMYPTTFGTPKSEEGAGFDRAIAAFVAEARVPLVFGAYDAEGADEYNAAIVLEPAGDGRFAFDAYRKTRLFPFTEYLPWPLSSSESAREWLPWAGTWRPGGGARVLPVSLADGRSLRVAPLVCYDALDPRLALAAVRDGAELLVTLSNDSWFAFPGVQRLILVLSAFRSIETRRPQVRSTPTGISAVIDETGALRDVIDVGERGVRVARLPRLDAHAAPTLAVAWGEWLPPAALTAALLLLVAASARRATRARPEAGARRRDPAWRSPR